MSKRVSNIIGEDSLAGRKLRPHEAAAFLGMSTSTLAKWRVYGIGPAFSRLSRGLVVYDGRDLEAFVVERKRLSTSDARAFIAAGRRTSTSDRVEAAR